MMRRPIGVGLVLTAVSVAPWAAGAQEAPAIPEGLQRTYAAFAQALVQGEAERAAAFYAEDAVVLVDHEHGCELRPVR